MKMAIYTPPEGNPIVLLMKSQDVPRVLWRDDPTAVIEIPVTEKQRATAEFLTEIASFDQFHYQHLGKMIVELMSIAYKAGKDAGGNSKLSPQT